MRNKKLVFILISIVIMPIFLNIERCESGSALTNGDFELGYMAAWSATKASVQSSSYYVHSGSYGCFLARYFFFTYQAGSIVQTIDYDVDDLDTVAFSFYSKSESNDLKINIYYSDYSNQAFTKSKTSFWYRHTIARSSLYSGKNIAQIKIERVGTSTKTTAIDDIEFHLQPYNLPNGDFETGIHWEIIIYIS